MKDKMQDKIQELIDVLKEQKETMEKNKTGNKLLWILAIIGAVCAIAGIAYAVYRYMTPDYLEDFDDDDFEDDFDDYFEDEEAVPAKAAE